MTEQHGPLPPVPDNVEPSLEALRAFRQLDISPPWLSLHLDRAAEYAARAERASDLADRFVRWGVGLILGAMVVLAFAVFQGDAMLGTEIADIRQELGAFRNQMDARFDALLARLAELERIVGSDAPGASSAQPRQ